MHGRKQFPERLKEWNTPQAWKQPGAARAGEPGGSVSDVGRRATWP